ncbi:MAG TPA: hypothetical protein VHZ76_03820 [Gammaproteobacteria bacterium]|nr:hypothetical protein [Gammaproteobacteria bacterium]
MQQESFKNMRQTNLEKSKELFECITRFNQVKRMESKLINSCLMQYPVI